MLLINQRQLELTALKDDQHPLHSYALEYSKGIKHLEETYGEQIKFSRIGYPKKAKGVDHRGKDVNNLLEPTPQIMIPLKARAKGKVGEEMWEYCSGAPKLLPNNLWEATGKRSKPVDDFVIVNVKKDPDLAFFFYYKSPIIKQLFKIDDPTAEARLEGDKAREELELQTALYQVLGDEEQLRVIAQAYGVNGTATKHPDAIRKELKDIVLAGNKKRRSDPTAKGVKEFLEELKVTDNVRLRSLVMTMIEAKKIVWFADGKYKIGERELCRVPSSELGNKQVFLTNHLANPANRVKLQDLLKDVVDKDYLDKITDDKTFSWLARTSGLPVEFKKKDDIKESVYAYFVVE